MSSLITLSPDAALILLKNVTLYRITDHWWLDQTVKKVIAFRSRRLIACRSKPSVLKRQRLVVCKNQSHAGQLGQSCILFRCMRDQLPFFRKTWVSTLERSFSALRRLKTYATSTMKLHACSLSQDFGWQNVPCCVRRDVRKRKRQRKGYFEKFK